jgi:V/A-type H+-transporting ATPase subunit I
VIVPMRRVRVLAPRADVALLLAALQDAGIVHPTAAGGPLMRTAAGRRQERLVRQLERALADVEGALALLPGRSPSAGAAAAIPPLPAAVRRARRLRRRVDALASRRESLIGERELLLRYQPLVTAFERLAATASPEQLRGHLVLLREGGEAMVATLRRALAEGLGEQVELRVQPLLDGGTALLALVPARLSPRLEALLAQARVEEARLPAAYGTGLLEALPRLRARQEELPRELRRVEAELATFARAAGPELQALRATLHDRLQALEVSSLVGHTERAAVVEGWVPAGGVDRLRRALTARLGERVAVEELSGEPWHGDEVPVELRNPRLFRPFEALVRPLPLPRYGSLDPTPFVAVFFPMFFGVMVGDLAHGALLGVGAWLLARGAMPGTLRHDLARIAGACALFTLVFGALYGELLGDLGRRWLGLHPLLFDREEAIFPFLVLAVGMGFVHLLLGLVVAAIAGRRREPRHALGRGLAALLLALVGAAVLAGVGVLPAGFLQPLVVAILVAFPALLAVEGVVAPVELLSTLGHVLSYARIMAIGTASVMLSVVANRMAGTFGSVVVGSLFALLFHLVNFALGVFSPAVHALRLHYVEFFGTCYSPGGVRYQPFAHWRPAAEA